jgi:hypothetical protein
VDGDDAAQVSASVGNEYYLLVVIEIYLREYIRHFSPVLTGLMQFRKHDRKSNAQ